MRALIVCVFTLAVLAGCGQKGPLVLPDANRHKVPPAAPPGEANPPAGKPPAGDGSG